jgi:hypothetical protein
VRTLGDGPNRPYKFGLLEIEIRFDVAGRHVSRQDQKRRPAFCSFADPCNCIGEAGSGMHAHKRQLSGRLGIGIGHAGSIAFVPRRNELDAASTSPCEILKLAVPSRPKHRRAPSAARSCARTAATVEMLLKTYQLPSFDSLTYP